uniref:Uncharacterized protein n=1 Tax=Rhizophora mucronata TaxID=61149 RepID=A0A2P2N4K8_RHIMU
MINAQILRQAYKVAGSCLKRKVSCLQTKV